MILNSGALTAVVWIAIVYGIFVTLAGLILIGMIFFGGSVPVSGAGMFTILTLGLGPLLTLAGVLTIISGAKLISGNAWASTAIQIISWTILFVTVVRIGYGGYKIYDSGDSLEATEVVRGVIFFIVVGAPAIANLILLNLNSVKRLFIK
jgi:hypothetical protein